MNNVGTFYTEARLALAAYGDFIAGIAPSTDELRRIGMAEDQARQFAQDWLVVDQYKDTTGLSATVFERDGKRYLAIRGTEQSLLDLTADFILANGFPAPLNPQFQSLKAKIQDWTSGGILPQTFTVAGHSLGGYLAAAVGLEYGSRVEAIYTYNAPGVDGGIGGVVNLLLQTLGITSSAAPSSLNNIRATAGFSAIANFGRQMASPILIETEFSLNPFENHSIVPLADSLAIYDLFAKIDPALNTTDPMVGVGKITDLLKAASSKQAFTLEASLDSLRKLFKDPAAPNPVPTATDSREQYYQNLSSLQGRIAPYAGTLTIDSLVGSNPAQLAGLAQGSDAVAYRYALKELNPFAIVGNNTIYDPHNVNGVLDLYNPATGSGLTAQYVTDRSEMLVNLVLRNSTDIRIVNPGTLEATDYIDRRVVLETSNGVTREVLKEDKVFVGGGLVRTGARQVAFGSDRPEKFEGSGFEDRLYGGGGTDTLVGFGGIDYLQGDQGGDVLNGGVGNDILDGGYGFDTYLWNLGDGRDTIRDDDGKGRLVINGTPLTWAFSAGANTWVSADGRLTLTQNSPLAIHAEDGSEIVIEDFQSGELGIQLKKVPPDPVPTRTILGDQVPEVVTGDAFWFDSNGNAFWRAADGTMIPPIGSVNHRIDPNLPPTGISIVVDGQTFTLAFAEFNTLDALGNLVVSGSEPDRADRIFDSLGNDLIQTLGGNDEVILLRGGRDHVQAGTGDDLVSVDPSRVPDALLIEGGTGSDVLAGDTGDDWIFAEDRVPIQELFVSEVSQAAPAVGDWIRSGDGDDVAVGAAGDDLLEGGRGIDLLLGANGNDLLLGDASGTVPGAPSETFPFSISVRGEVTALAVQVSGNADGGADTMYGGGGSDVIRGQGGDDVIDGGVGEDNLGGGAGADTVLGGSGNDLVHGDGTLEAFADHGADYLDGGDGNDQVIGDGGADILVGGAGADSLVGDREDIASGFHGDDFLDGGDGDDTLVGNGGADTLIGGAGIDTLTGGDGQDYLAGGEGNDILDGGDGDDVYVFNLGDGIDTLGDSGASGFDTLVFGEGISSDVLSLALGSFLIRVGAGEDAIHVEGFNANDVLGSPVVENFVFADGVELPYTELVAQGFNIVGGAGNDFLQGTSVTDRFAGGQGSDTYLFGRGSGQDTIEDLDTTGFDVDTVQVGADVIPVDITVSRAGDFITLAINDTSDQISIHWQPQAGYQVERVVFANGAVWNEVMLEAMAGGGGNVTPILAAPIADQTATEDEAFNFTIPFGTFTDANAGDTLAFSAALTDGSPLPGWLAFDAATQIFSGTAENADVGTVSVRVTATDSANSSASDVFDLTVANTNDAPVLLQPLADLTTTERQAFSFVVLEAIFGDVDATDTLTYAAALAYGGALPSWLDFDSPTRTFSGMPGEYDIETSTIRVTAIDPSGAQASDEFNLSVALLPGVALTGTSGQDTLTGGPGADTISARAGADTLTGNAGWDVLNGGDGADQLIGGTGNDTLNGGFGADTLFGDDGADILSGEVGADTLWGGAGNDTLNGGDGGDTLRGEAGEDLLYGDIGADTLYGGIGNDYLFGGIGGDQILGEDGTDILQGGDGADSLLGATGNDLLEDRLGADTLKGDVGNDFLAAGGGADTYKPGAGEDVIAFNRGDGSDMVRSTGGPEDTVSVGGGIAYQELTLAKSNNDLVLNAGLGDKIVLKDWYAPTPAKSVLNLQVIAEAMAGFDPVSTDPLLNRKVQSFDFQGLVGAFDQARAANPALTSWALTNALLDFHLSGSDSEALGGDLAYQHGKNGSLTGISLNAAQDVIGSAQFGLQPQALRPLASLQEGLVKLS